MNCLLILPKFEKVSFKVMLRAKEIYIIMFFNTAIDEGAL